MNNDNYDDGSLSCLGIPRDESSRHFNCPEIGQQRLINTPFYIVDIISDVKTKYGSDRMLVKIKFSLDDSEADARKFFTGSGEIKHILQHVKDMNKFPRKVTLRAVGNRYFLE
ncbi:MAG: hypothetical protein PHU68_01260 [Paludibacter sp.]|nr:hypothetical protein [Paludibacter sp.]